MPMEKWDNCVFTVNEDELEGRACYGGLDLSSTMDITAFVLVFPPEDEEANTSSCRTSGYRRTISIFVFGAIMCHMMCGSGRDICKRQKAM